MRIVSVPRPMPVTFTSGRATLRARGFEFLQAFLRDEDRRRRAIGHHADVEAGQRPGHHRRVAHILDGDALALLRVRVVEGVDVVLHADVRHLLDGRAELLHVARDHHGVVARIKTSDGIVERHVGGQRDELISFPGLHVGHGLEAVGHAHVHVAAGDGLPRFLETESAGRAAAFHAMAGLGAQTRGNPGP